MFNKITENELLEIEGGLKTIIEESSIPVVYEACKKVYYETKAFFVSETWKDFTKGVVQGIFN